MTETAPEPEPSPTAAGRLSALRRRFRAGGWVQGVIETLVVRIGLVAVGLVGSVVLARVLGPGGRGELYLAMTLATLGSTVLNLGMHASNTYRVSKDRSLLGVTTGNSVVFSLAMGAAVGVVAGSLALFEIIDMPLTGVLLALVVVALPLQIATYQLHPLLIVIDELRRYNALEVVQRGSGLIVVVALWAAGGVTPSNVFAGTTLILFATVLWLVARLRRASATGLRPSFGVLRGGAGFAGRAYLGGLSTLLLLRIDVVLIDAELGAVAVGLYSVAASVGDLLQMLPATVGNLLFPRLSAMDDGPERRRLAVRCTVAVVGLLSAAAMPVALVAEDAIRLVYGSDFVDGAPALRWLLPGLVLLGANTVLMNYLAAMGMPLVALVSPLAGLATNVALNLVLIPAHGIVGAAAASTISYVFMTAITGGWIVLRGRGPMGGGRAGDRAASSRPGDHAAPKV